MNKKSNELEVIRLVYDYILWLGPLILAWFIKPFRRRPDTVKRLYAFYATTHE